MVMPDMDLFLSLSVDLTGFSKVELQGTGLSELYLKEVVSRVGEDVVSDLFGVWVDITEADPEERPALIRDRILSIETLGDTARNIIILWYLGQWSSEAVVSAEAYKQGLVWGAVGAHPQGAKQQGFGVWSLDPNLFANRRRSSGKGAAS